MSAGYETKFQLWHAGGMGNAAAPESLCGLHGLSDAEAALRLASEGPNELPRQRRRSLLHVLRDVLREPMLALLQDGGGVYLLLGDIAEALILLSFACLSAAITVVQETRTERVLEALPDLTSPRALVVCGGVQKRVAGREVVRGDIIVLTEGDRVPADAIVRIGRDLQADESLLTGESVPVRKRPATDADASQTRPGGEDLSMIFSGSLIVRGTGTGEVTATGTASEIGRIGRSLAAIAQLVRLFGVMAGQPLATIFKDWTPDVFTATAADVQAEGHPLPDPGQWISGNWAPYVSLAGSETSAADPGYLAGALDAAERAVAEVVRRL